MSDLPSSAPAYDQARRTKRRLFWISLPCIIAICFVLDTRFIRKLSPPAAMTVIPSQNQQTIVALTPDRMRLCGLASGPAWPFIRVACDWRVGLVHSLTLSGIPKGANWHMVLGFGWRWWTYGVSPVAGMLADPSLPLIPFQPIQNISNTNNPDTNFLSLPGTVVTQDGVPTRHAVLIAQNSEGKRAFAQTDAVGNFVLNIDPAWISSDVELTVWAEEGWVRIPQPVEILVNVGQTVRLEQYAKN